MMTLRKANSGLLVVIDGIDGCGKTTQVRLLHDRLRTEGFRSAICCEPTGGPWGQKLRESAVTGRFGAEEELNVILNDRKDDVVKCIKPNLDLGAIVILDRYYTSTLAYQSIRGLSEDVILARNTCFAPAPDIVIILEIDPDKALQRIQKRDGLPDKFESADLHDVASKFGKLKLPGLMRLDADKPISAIHEEIYQTVKNRLVRL